ncbi:hypothetical protein [Methylobacterium sp. JK268]
MPFPLLDTAATHEAFDQHLGAIRQAYWLSHRALGSRVRLALGTAYAIPDVVGPAEVAVLDGALSRLRDPFRALHAAARFTRETVIVTDLAAPRRWWRDAVTRPRHLPAFLVPRADRPSGWYAWWRLPPAIVREMLAILGFGESAVHRPRPRPGEPPFYTVVARRTDPTNDDLGAG